MPVARTLLALLLLSGCGALYSNGPTDVARGEYHSAGRPEYDSFFILLHEKQVELLSAPQEPRAAREGLTSVLGLTAEASEDVLTERLRQQLQKLANQGLNVRLEIPPPSPSSDASATLHASEETVLTPLRVTLPHEATRLVRARNRMVSTRAELEKLRVMGITLEGDVDRAFRAQGPWKRDEVRANLSDGQKVITLMQARANEVEASASQLLGMLGAVAVTDPNLGRPVPPSEPVEEPSRRAAARAGSSRRVAAPSRPRTPTERSAPPASSEGEAAPRPIQGNAPAEIEP